jgi:hypothetical protein
VAALFTKFDPRTFLESEEPRATPAKAANVAKVLDGPAPALASLAALAACDLDSHDSAAAPEAELIAPSPWFESVARPAEGEPGFELPCAARRGRVGDLDGVFVHFCAECGRWGVYGCGVNLRAGRLGRWYCAAHRPQGTAR